MNDARSQILTRIRAAQTQALLPDAGAPPGQPPTPPPFTRPLADVFCQALTAVQGKVTRVENEEAACVRLLSEFKERGVSRVLCWDPDALGVTGLADALAAGGIELVPSIVPSPDRAQTLARLAQIQVGLTAAAAGLARTGSVVLHASRAQGRLASLLPPTHYAILHVSQLHPDLAAWLASESARAAIARSSNTVIITGPSRSADIAQTLTLGAHGPKEVRVILIG